MSEDETDDQDDEELGWDDDDEDLDDLDDEDVGGDDDNEDDDRNETVEFKDAEKDRLQGELDQALSERELLHKTVELQGEELKKLKELTSGDESKQFEALTMQCFEKDSELAALRARLEDTHEEDEDGGDDDGTAAATADAAKEALQKMTQLQTELANKDLQLAELNEALANAKQELQVSQESLSLGQPEPQQAMEQLSAESQACRV